MTDELETYESLTEHLLQLRKERDESFDKTMRLNANIRTVEEQRKKYLYRQAEELAK